MYPQSLHEEIILDHMFYWLIFSANERGILNAHPPTGVRADVLRRLHPAAEILTGASFCAPNGEQFHAGDLVIKRLGADESMVLGETYEEAADLVQTVMAEAVARGHRNVVCIFDQNMEYPAGPVLGTDITAKLREAGFKGVIVIRSANDEPAMQKLYLKGGANGHLPKHGKIGDIVSTLLRIYSRALRMGLC